MSETLTYDPGTDTVSTEENLTPEEQDSLKVGEALDAEHESFVDGKYKNAKELEDAYIALQKKMGENSETSEDSQEPPEEEVSEDPVESSFLDTIWEEANSEYKEETLEQLRGMDPTDLANQYIEYRKNNQTPAKQQLSDRDVSELKSVVGGDKNYSNMMEWAQTNLNQQDIDMFDAVMEQGNPLAAFFAVRSLAYRYQDAVGYDGRMLQGKPAADKAQGFRSQAELVSAMEDPRYEDDPAYRQDIMRKLESSGNLNF